MAIVVTQEGIEDGKLKFSGKNATMGFMVTGTSVYADAMNAVTTSLSVPTIFEGKNRIDAEIELTEIGVGVWRANIPFDIDTVQPSTFQISFDISGQTTKITQAKTMPTAYGRPSETPKNFRGTIGVNQDGSIEGVDIFIPFLSACYTYLFPGTTVNNSFIGSLYKTVGKTNNAAWGPYAKGEALLTKVTGQRKDNNYWELVFTIAASENKANIKIGDTGTPSSVITVANKAGWQYLWVYYQDEKVDVGGGLSFVHKVPQSAYVCDVYDSADYSIMGFNPSL